MDEDKKDELWPQADPPDNLLEDIMSLIVVAMISGAILALIL